MRPPRVALAVLRLLLPARHYEPIAGDLEEEWRASPRPSRRGFWITAMRSILACAVDEVRTCRTRAPASPRPTGDSAMQSLMQDVRFGLRLLWHHPGFTAAATATLAIGIGANTAIFSIVNILTLEPLMYRAPDRVAFVLGWDIADGDMRFSLREADHIDLRRDARSLEDVAAYAYVSANLTGGDMPDRVQAYRVTPNTFSLLGVPAAAGRTFDESDMNAGREDLAVISYGLWQRRFGGEPSVVGRRIQVNDRPVEIVGVMPQRFEYPVFNFKGDLWMMWPMRHSARGQADAAGSATVVARLRRGVTYGEAQSELDALMRRYAEQYPDTNRGLGVRVIEMGRLDDEQAGPALIILMTTVGLVLVLACANVANLLLARGAARQRELAVRAAIGASRVRIARQLLLEGLLLAALGGSAGVLLAVAATSAIRRALPAAVVFTMPNVEEIGVDATTLAYALALTLLTSLMFGAFPAWRASRDRFDGTLKESASLGGSRGARRLRGGLVVAEVAIATVLVLAAGLLVRSYRHLQDISPGFDAASVMTMAMTLPEDRYREPSARREFYEAVVAGVERLPGVASAAVVNVLPFSTYDRGTRLVIDGASAPEPGREPSLAYRSVSPRYFDTLRIPVRAGRAFDRRDVADGQPVAIVNEAAAGRYFDGSLPLGRRIRFGDDTPWRTIVGVIGNVQHSGLIEPPRPEVYVPMAQAPAGMMMLAARTAVPPETLTQPMREAVQRVDPTQPVYHERTLASLVGDALLAWQTSAALVSIFGAIALLLAAIGVYGVIAYAVSQQTREFGVRLALGATPRELRWRVLRTGGVMVGGGMLIGLVAAAGLAQALRAVLVAVTPVDPLTYVVACVLLSGMGLIACLVPAWRAAATDPLSALRSE